MADASISESLSTEIHTLKELISHARAVGAVNTHISIDLLALLLATYDASKA